LLFTVSQQAQIAITQLLLLVQLNSSSSAGGFMVPAKTTFHLNAIFDWSHESCHDEVN